MAPKRFVIPAMNDDDVESDGQSDQEWMEMLCLEHDNHRKAVSAATRALKATEDRMVRQRDRMMRKRLAKKLRSSDVEKSVDKTDGNDGNDGGDGNGGEDGGSKKFSACGSDGSTIQVPIST
jgi:hypothetical protein